MKFGAFKQFRFDEPLSLDGTLSAVKEMVRYLRVDVTNIIRDLEVGLKKLEFTENFESFSEEVTIASGAELPIRNRLRTAIPSKRLVVRGGSGSQDIVDGDTTWTLDYVYLKNVGASSVTATVQFFK